MSNFNEIKSKMKDPPKNEIKVLVIASIDIDIVNNLLHRENTVVLIDDDKIMI